MIGGLGELLTGCGTRSALGMQKGLCSFQWTLWQSLPQYLTRPQRPFSARESTKQDEEECAICLDPLAEDGTTLTLPCGHDFHGSCVEGLRARGVAKVCPLCRGELPAGPDQLFEEATRRLFVVEARVKRGQTSWEALSTADQRELKAVVQLNKNAAAQGSGGAAYNLGFMYANGRGVQQNYVETVKWYRRGAEQGLAEAQNNLGDMYGKGEGVQQDNAEAVKWYHRAAEQGHAMGQYNLGTIYANGWGVQQDFSKAGFWLEKAAFQNFKPAKLALEQLRSNLVRASSSDSPMSSSDARGTCGHCAARASSGTSLKSCSRCGIVFYCGRDCQLAHWKAGHQKSCKARNN